MASKSWEEGRKGSGFQSTAPDWSRRGLDSWTMVIKWTIAWFSSCACWPVVPVSTLNMSLRTKIGWRCGRLEYSYTIWMLYTPTERRWEDAIGSKLYRIWVLSPIIESGTLKQCSTTNVLTHREARAGLCPCNYIGVIGSHSSAWPAQVPFRYSTDLHCLVRPCSTPTLLLLYRLRPHWRKTFHLLRSVAFHFT